MVCRGYSFRTALGVEECEAVYRFRFEHFFRCYPDGYPGLDRTRGRLFEKHDPDSTHFCAFDKAGRLCAVSTATPATVPGIPGHWREWFELERFSPLGLSRVVVSTRMVMSPECRGTGLFGLFYRFIMERYFQAGFACAVHYCSPGFISRYEALGHRLFGKPFIMPPEFLRVPMIIDLNDLDYLRRVNPDLATLHDLHCPGPALLPVSSMIPELEYGTNFHLLTPEDRLGYIREKLGPNELSQRVDLLPLLEHAALLRLRKGLFHKPPKGGGFLCLVLSGLLEETGARRPAGPGSFVCAGLPGDPPTPPSSFIVLEDSEVLVFDQAYISSNGGRKLAGSFMRKDGCNVECHC